MVSSTVFAVLLAAVTFVSAARWGNDWFEKLDFTCEPNSGEGIYMIETDGKVKRGTWGDMTEFDRKWGFDCTGMGASKDHYDCKWYSDLDGGWTNEKDWINYYRKSFKIECPNNGIVAGFKSIYEKNYEDRIWNVYCCNGLHTYADNCVWRSPWRVGGQYDDDWRFEFNGDKEFIRGVKSFFNGRKMDRSWEFEVCKTVNCWTVPTNEKRPSVVTTKGPREVNSVGTLLNCNSRHSMEFEEGPETSLSNTVEISNAKGQESSKTESLSFSVGASYEAGGNSLSLTAGGSIDTSKSQSTEETKTKTYSTTSSANALQNNIFPGPSAMMIMSETDTYIFQDDSYNVTEVWECEGVEENTVVTRPVAISVKTYGHTHFTSRYAKFKSEKYCVDNQMAVENCLNQLRFWKGENKAIGRAFEECFAKRDSSGNVLYSPETNEQGQRIPLWLDGIVDHGVTL